MNATEVRVRFAPSPTGGLHLGGVRTALFNYLFAKKYNGKMILRVEDTDQTRFVPGAEEYITQCLEWCGIKVDESPELGGSYSPYRQSDRKPIYREYAEKLIASGNAYYAFDTPEELELMRGNLKTDTNPTPQYDMRTRTQMRNSLTMSADEVKDKIASGAPYVVRFKMPADETITFTDLIRGEISNDSNLLDDKVLLKSDGMPTYHLAVVVDDYLMKISHIMRGEEWLPSAPLHVMLWKKLGWEDVMPKFGHMPLILKPDGNGKLSKRDGDRLGFPVFAMDWFDPKTGEQTIGFKERGFLPDAFLNMLAFLGWHPGTEQEIFSLKELETAFSVERISKSGAKFDYEKAKWFNAQHLHHTDDATLAPLVLPFLNNANISADNNEKLVKVIGLVKDRCQLLADFVAQAGFFYNAPETIDIDSIKGKWTAEKTQFFEKWINAFDAINNWKHDDIKASFEAAVADAGIKKGELMMPLRIMLVGGKFGPNVMDIMEVIGMEACKDRIINGLKSLS
jgi:glutamyl-tRNA synthetase